jgi:hypothetical protein
MKNILFLNEKYGNWILKITFSISFLIIAYYHLSSGFSMSTDSARFSLWADTLIKLNFNFFDFFLIEKTAIRPHLFFFSVPVFAIALCKIIFVNNWQYVFLLFNLLLVFFSLMIFVKTLRKLDVRPIFISLSLPVIVISVDILVWPKFILSDMIYAFFVLLATYFIIKGILIDKVYYLQLFLVIILLLASRPSSFPVIFSIIFFIFISKYQFLFNSKIILLSLITLFISTPFVFSLLFSIIELNFNGARVDFIVNMVKAGTIIHDRPETWVDIPNNFIDIVNIYFLRLINFFNPYASTFSVVHIILNIIQLFVILLSILIWSLSSDVFKISNKIFLFILSLSFFVAAFHSFILIDYDWRYRFPIILPLIMLFPLSLESFFKR